MLDGLREITRRYAEAFSAAWRERGINPDARRRRGEAAFLPAMLEIQETPPHPAARVTMWLIIVLFAIGGLWAFFGHTDIVATAAGKVLPDSRIKIVQAPHGGVVEEILVQDGDHVLRGDALLKLDDTASSADAKTLRGELASSKLEAEMTRLLSAMEPADPPPQLNSSAALANVDAARITAQQRDLDNIFHEQKSRRAQLKDEIRTLQADLATERQGVAAAREQRRQSELATRQRLQGERHQIEKVEALLPIAEGEHAAFQSLYEKNIVSRLQVEQAREKVLSLQSDLLYRQNQLEEIGTAGETEQMRHARQAEQYESRAASFEVRIEAKRQELAVERTRFRREMTERHSAAQRRTRELEQQLVKAEQLERMHHITAPADGIVQQMKIHTRGAVVQAAEALMVIVPKQHTLEVEAFVENKDIGFVYVGQEAEVKVDAFPYTKFGLISGEVSHISADAIEDEKRGLIYQAKIRLHQSALIVDGEERPLAPGMSVVVEIKTGKRRIIEFLMAPLIQHGKESLGER